MSKELFLELTPFGARAAVMRHGELLEVRFADNEVSDIRGQIFHGRVRSIEKGMDAAFIDCGHGQIAYLAGRDGRWASGQRRDEPLSKQLTEGQSIIVQGSGVSRDGKKPKVTTDIQVSGMFSVFRPRRRSIKLSNRLSDTGRSQHLRALARDLFTEGGAIIRGAAVDANDDDLRRESERLRELWDEIKAKAEKVKAPADLFTRTDPIHRILHETIQPEFSKVVTGDRVALARARTFLEAGLPEMAKRLECVPGAFAVNGINEQLDQALESKIELKSGGNIIIETTAALTAIDVNSGGGQPLETNIEAAKALARQLRLQRIGGTIVVDFINLENRRDQDALVTALKAAFADDPAAVQILPPTQLGLVQISRQRLGKSLRERLNRPCPSCTGSGAGISLQVSLERMLAELSEKSPPTGVKVHLAIDLYEYLAKDAIEPVRDFITKSGMPVPQLQADQSLAAGTYQIVGS